MEFAEAEQERQDRVEVTEVCFGVTGVWRERGW